MTKANENLQMLYNIYAKYQKGEMLCSGVSCLDCPFYKENCCPKIISNKVGDEE